MAEISAELDQLSVALIETAIDMMEAGDVLPIMLALDCSSQLYFFEDDTPDVCYRAACEKIAEFKSECTRYVLLYDGMVQTNDNSPSEPALLFEFAERGMAHAWSGYVLYRRAKNGKIETSDPAPAGEESLLFG